LLRDGSITEELNALLPKINTTDLGIGTKKIRKTNKK
jgi:hypothetical protein